MLRKVKLYGELADFVGHKELDAVITCTADAIRFLVSNFPKLEAHMSQRYYKVLVARHRISWIKFLLSETCLLYTSPSPRDRQKSRMPSSA